MNCHACDASIPTDSIYCPHCGQQVQQATSDNRASSPPQAAPAGQATPSGQQGTQKLQAPGQQAYHGQHHQAAQHHHRGPGQAGGHRQAANQQGAYGQAGYRQGPRFVGFWRRVGANLVDGLILGVPSFLMYIGLLAAFTNQSNPGPYGSSPDPAGLIAGFLVTYIVASTLLSWLYFAGFEGSSKQATPGKMAVGAKVVDRTGGPIGFGHASGRFFAKTLSTLLLYIGFFMIGWTQRKQGLHDKVAGTYVVRS